MDKETMLASLLSIETSEWDREKRYTSLHEVSAYSLETLKSKVAHAPFRLTYHIQPPCGLLNDPNGFCYFNGEYHLFYQWFPLGPVHGLKHWYHVKSKDLVSWEDCGVALIPDGHINSHGAYSGSGFILNDSLHVFYTANRRDKNWKRSCSQVIAKLMPNGLIETVNDAIESIPPEYTEHFRDPKVWQEGELFYAIIGAQRKCDLKGTGVIYRSLNGKDWQFIGEINTQLTQFGYMWECPDYFCLTEENESFGVFIFSPQGLNPTDDKFQNIYQSGYIVGPELNLPNLTFSHGEFHELDFGFDFYAPQTTMTPDGRRIMIAWMGLPEIEYPSDKDGWAHCLTLPRELTLIDGKIFQHPVKELQNLRKEVIFKGYADDKSIIGRSAHFELILSDDSTFDNFELALFASDPLLLNNKDSAIEKLTVRYDSMARQVTIDREFAGIAFATKYGTTRCYKLSKPLTHIQLFGDTSSLEVFFNHGEAAASLRHFSAVNNNAIIWQGHKTSVTLWQY
ncbi:sucrose-6-phosphate hydrolase [Thorsellia anophelis]|uniref:Sucrose-6-phosphate hydrolase n=1 Tax=Thorsellia anophelis DSM 18579 TaxID=1123402 RepID=A0A1H9YTU2_9GAMM|nr:sucrose-6-phosphate hydrolase [Thorsellia anophelis]SES72580.1 beta-fructofuranosidase [Thorsellia anophelis DSM 18579]